MYLVVIRVANEREQRFHEVASQSEGAEYIFKLKQYMATKGVGVSARVYQLPEPVEVVM